MFKQKIAKGFQLRLSVAEKYNLIQFSSIMLVLKLVVIRNRYWAETGISNLAGALNRNGSSDKNVINGGTVEEGGQKIWRH